MVFVSTPESRRRQSERLKAVFADPEVRKRTHAGASARMKRVNLDPAFKARREAKRAIDAWCPPELRADYLKLRALIGAAKAKTEILMRACEGPSCREAANDLGTWKTPRYWPLDNIRIGER